MSYDTYEVSNQDGAPISYYEIKWGNTVWRYTSADSDQTITIPVDGSVTFTAIAISDSGMRQGGSSNNDLSVTVQSDIPLVDLFASTPPSDEIHLTVRRAHLGDLNPVIHWKGLVRNVKRDEGNAQATIIGFALMALFEGDGLRLAWTRGCPHILYDGECRKDPETMKVETTITALDGNSITVASNGGHAAPWFTGGYIEWTANGDGTLDRRGILSSASDTQLVLLGTTYRLSVGMAVKLYPGCDLTDETCDTKFNNLPNYGGCRQMTGKNPFDGTRIA